eukprot:1742511-Pleurochrysis_carterae.AAC.1
MSPSVLRAEMPQSPLHGDSNQRRYCYLEPKPSTRGAIAKYSAIGVSTVYHIGNIIDISYKWDNV